MTSLDIILLAALIIVLPAEALWKSVARRSRPQPALAGKLLRSLRVVLLLLGVLAAAWSLEDRPLSWLGLEAPLSTGGLVGLAIAVSLVGLLAIGTAAKGSRLSDTQAAAAGAMLPETPQERTLFILFAFAAGIGWELLYRGYLLWALTPLIGLTGAVVVAAIAYALGHGSRGSKSLLGSVVSSFLFTLGFVLTGSLWWLILLHIGLPLVSLAAMRPLQASRT